MGSINWIDLAQDSDRWWALVNVLMNLQFPSKGGRFFDWLRTSWLLKKDSAQWGKKVSKYKWHVGSRWYTPDVQMIIIRTDAFIPPWHQGVYPSIEVVSSVFSQAVTSCLTSASAEYHLPTKRQKSLCLISDMWLATTLLLGSFEVFSLRSQLVLSDFCLFWPCKTHPVGKRFAPDTDMKQDVTYWLQTLDTDFF